MIIVLQTKSKHNKDFFKNSSFSLAGITGREIRKERKINMFKSVRVLVMKLYTLDQDIDT